MAPPKRIRDGKNSGATQAPASVLDGPSVMRKGSRAKIKYPYGLTARELEVLALACSGLSNSEIAKRCGVSTGVVKIHLHHAYGKLGVQGRVQAIPIVERMDAIQQIWIRDLDQRAPTLDWLIPHMTHERHATGDVLFRKGDPGNRLYYVQTGCVDLPEIGARMRQGELFGEFGIFAREHRRTSSALCASAVDLFVITSEHAKILCVENPLFAVHLIGLIADRLTDERKSSPSG